MGKVYDDSFTLPSGKVVELDDVPENASMESIKDEILRKGLATLSDFKEAAPTPPPEDPSMLDNVGGFLKKNMEIPVGIGGSLAGAGAGFLMGGPPGALVGGVLGGALGSGGGSAYSDVLAGEQINLREAGKEAAISAGMDLVTLGAAKYGKPVISVVGETLGFGAKELDYVVAKVTEVPLKVLTAGSQASKQATQRLLEQAGGSLSAFQTETAGSFRRMSEYIGERGMFSSSYGQARREANVNALREETQRIIDGTLGASELASPQATGALLYNAVDQARRASITAYGEGLDVITQTQSRDLFSTSPLVNVINSHLKKEGLLPTTVYPPKPKKFQRPDPTAKPYEKNVTSALDPAALSIITNLQKDLAEAGKADVASLLGLEKKLNREIADAGNFNSTKFNGTVQAQLSEFSKVFKVAIEDVMTVVDPQSLAKYRALNADYTAVTSALFPTLSRQVFEKGNKGSMEAIGRIAVSTGDTDQLKSIFTSIDAAYASLKSRGIDPEGAIKTATHAKEIVRQGYLKNIFGDTSGAFDPSNYAKLARRLEKDSTRVQAIMGKEYPAFKQLLNAMQEATIDPKGGFGSLVLHSKEVGAMSNMLQITGATVGGSYAGGAIGALGSFAVFAVPMVMAKVATNPKAIRQLLLLDNQARKLTGAHLTAFLTAGTAKILDNFSEEDMREIRNELRDMAGAEQDRTLDAIGGQ